MQKLPDFESAAARKNQYELHYGEQKGVHYPVWSGAEGDQAALTRATYPSTGALNYFNGPVYNQQYRNLVTTALQGKGRSIYDRVQLTGAEDYSTDGRTMPEYDLVSMGGGLGSTDYLIAMVVIAVGVGYIFFSR